MTEKPTGRFESCRGQIPRRPTAGLDAGRYVLATVLILLLSLTPVGCSRKDAGRKHRRLEGTIEKIDQANSQVTLAYYSEKHRTEVLVVGQVTSETEIFINGALSSLTDLREGERVTVIGWVQGHGGDRTVVAVTVTVQRAETIRRGPAG